VHLRQLNFSLYLTHLVGRLEGHSAWKIYRSNHKRFSFRVQKNPGFVKKAQPTGFLGFRHYWIFWTFYLNEQLGSLLDLAHQLSFYLDSAVVKSLIITGTTN